VKHFIDEEGNIWKRFWIRERKRGKRQKVVINQIIASARILKSKEVPGL
jgi:hypothetical protein